MTLHNDVNEAEVAAIVDGDHGDPFAYLGLHEGDGGLVLRAMLPGARAVAAIDPETRRTIVQLRRVHDAGMFVGTLARRTRFRYRLRVDEMRESVRIIEQCLEGMPGGAWIADDRKVVLPPRHELHTSMESLIHHFKIVTEGYRVPEGEVYVAVESPRGEFGCYLVSDGGPRPWRVKFRAPSFVALEATATCVADALVADMIAIVGSLDTVMGEVDR